MATQNLPSLSPPEFPQQIITGMSEKFWQYNGGLIEGLWRLGERCVPPPVRSTCDHEYQWGLNSGGIRCTDLAVVHHIESELAFCLEHFWAVERG